MNLPSVGFGAPAFLRANAFRASRSSWVLALAPACGGNDPGRANNDPGASAQTTGGNVAFIGAEGGSLILDDITLTVPPGALSETKELRLEKLDANTTLPDALALRPVVARIPLIWRSYAAITAPYFSAIMGTPAVSLALMPTASTTPA